MHVALRRRSGESFVDLLARLDASETQDAYLDGGARDAQRRVELSNDCSAMKSIVDEDAKVVGSLAIPFTPPAHQARDP